MYEWDPTWEKIAYRAARDAGELLRARFGKIIRIDYKGEINLVTEADLESERIIVTLLEEHFPHHTIIAEEGGGKRGEAPYQWFIDPLDGTTNYAHGLPIFSISIALAAQDELLMGIVYDPLRDELFFARKGKGAFLNGTPISVSHIASMDKSLLATGFPYDARESKDNNVNFFSSFVRHAQAIRRCGSAALDLAYVAAGRFDGFWEIKLKPWDVAAGALMVREAGGVISNFSGNTLLTDPREILASNSKIHSAMVEIIQQTSKDYPHPS